MIKKIDRMALKVKIIYNINKIEILKYISEEKY